MRTEKYWSPFPDPRQELLLKACLLGGDVAIASWQAWRNSVDIKAVDPASQRLLPLAFVSLMALGVNGSELEQCKDLALQVWCENQLRASTVSKLLVAFEVAEIPVMVLKGFALAPLYYGGWELRSASDVDLLVPPPLVADAAHVLSQQGWITPNVALLISASYLTTTHAAPFTDTQGTGIDLHWHVVHERCTEAADDEFWACSQPFEFNDTLTARTLGDTDQLFHTILHGSCPNRVAPIRWIADAAMILRASEIDWHRFLRHTVEGHFILRVRNALRYLHEVFSLPVPVFVLEQLASMRQSSIETLEEWLARANTPRLLQAVGSRYAHYRRNAGASAAPPNFLAYLQTVWGVPTKKAALREATRRLAPYISPSRPL